MGTVCPADMACQSSLMSMSGTLVGLVNLQIGARYFKAKYTARWLNLQLWRVITHW